MGRTRRSVHQQRADDRDETAPQARRPRGHPHRPRRWIPDPVRLTLRLRLTLLYGGLFTAAAALVVAATCLLVRATLRTDSSSITVIGDKNKAERGSTVVDARTGRPLGVRALNELIAAKQRSLRDQTLHHLLTDSTLVLVAVALVTVVLGYLLAGRALRPLTAITATVHRIAGQNLHERISLPRPHDEIRDLTETFNAMLARLDRTFEAQRQFAAQASHELKTPLATARTLLELALEETGTSAESRDLASTLLAVTVRYERLIDGLLTLARSDHDVVDRHRVELDQLAADALSSHASDAEAAGLRIEHSLRPAAVLGDPVLLERLVHNLIDNAIRYNHPRGSVTVTTAVGAAGTRITVTNSGPAVSGRDVPRLFEPFHRHHTGTHGDGTGLGLAIVRAVSHVHQGTITARPRHNGGLSITITFPACQPVSRGPAEDCDGHVPDARRLRGHGAGHTDGPRATRGRLA